MELPEAREHADAAARRVAAAQEFLDRAKEEFVVAEDEVIAILTR